MLQLLQLFSWALHAISRSAEWNRETGRGEVLGNVVRCRLSAGSLSWNGCVMTRIRLSVPQAMSPLFAASTNARRS